MTWSAKQSSFKCLSITKARKQPNETIECLYGLKQRLHPDCNLSRNVYQQERTMNDALEMCTGKHMHLRNWNDDRGSIYKSTCINVNTFIHWNMHRPTVYGQYMHAHVHKYAHHAKMRAYKSTFMHEHIHTHTHRLYTYTHMYTHIFLNAYKHTHTDTPNIHKYLVYKHIPECIQTYTDT